MVICSIRWRLQLWLGFLLVGVLAGFGLMVHQLQGVTQRGQLEEDLERRVAALNLAVRGGAGPTPGGFRSMGGPAGEEAREGRRMPSPDLRGDGDRPRPMGPPPDGTGMSRSGPPKARIPEGAFEEAMAGGPPGGHAAVWSREGVLLRRTEVGPPVLPIPSRPGRSTQMHFRDRDGLLECYQFTELGDCVLAGRSLQPLKRAQRRLGWNLAGVGAAVLALGLGGGWWLSTRALRPVEEIRAAAERISGGVLSERIASTEPDSEVGRLAGVLNATFDRLEAAFVRQRRFTDDAAHELRTPLAVLLVEAQSALSRDRSPEEYRETLHATLASAQQMRRLTDSLLQLARLDEGDGLASTLPVDVGEVARAQAEALRPLAVGKGLQLEVHTVAARAFGDAERLGQVVTNLVANAIQYTPSGGTVKVHSAASEDSCLLVVQDSGIGIAAEDLPHVFDRFFRADRARRRAEGHSGLGLAICRAIVEAHQGRISVESAPGVGSTFTVRLPAAKAA
jgi:two-component system, OmpR family, sensor kinase